MRNEVEGPCSKISAQIDRNIEEGKEKKKERRGETLSRRSLRGFSLVHSRREAPCHTGFDSASIGIHTAAATAAAARATIIGEGTQHPLKIPKHEVIGRAEDSVGIRKVAEHAVEAVSRLLEADDTLLCTAVFAKALVALVLDAS